MTDQGSSDQGPAETTSERLLGSLLTTLLSRTRAGELSWDVDDAHTDSYCLSGDGWLLASRSVDGDGVAPYVVLITDASGEPVLEVRSSRPYARSFREQFGELHTAAAASAVIAEATPMLNSIVAELTPSPASEPSKASKPGKAKSRTRS